MSPRTSNFEEDFLLQLRADLALTLGLPAANIHVGAEPPDAGAGLTVWIQPVAGELGGPLRVHRFEVEVRSPAQFLDGRDCIQGLSPVVRALGAISVRCETARRYARALPALIGLEVDGHRLRLQPRRGLLTGALTLRVGERL